MNRGHVAIALGRRRGVKRSGAALVDSEDFGLVSRYGWALAKNGYAIGRVLGQGPNVPTVYMHRLILGLESGDERQADHVNGNKLDNRRENLRICTDAENRQNGGSKGGSSQFRGVSWDKRRQRWEAYASLNRRRHHLGYFDDEEEAAVAAATWRAGHMPFSEDAREGAV